MLAAATAAALLLVVAAAPPLDVAHAQSMPPPPSLAPASAAGNGTGEFSSPRGIFMYNDGRILVADTGNHRIQVFHPNGTFNFAFGRQGNGTGELSSPRGITLDQDGVNILVADTGNHRIQVFHPNGTFNFAFGRQGNGTGELSSPEGVVQDHRRSDTDDFLVADTGNHRIQVFLPDGTYVTGFGSYGSEPEQFDGPTSVVAFSTYYIAVADTGNDRLQFYDYGDDFGVRAAELYDDGTGGINASGIVQVSGPRSLDLRGSAQFTIADTGNHRVHLVAASGDAVHTRIVHTIGSYGNGTGEFISPEAAAVSFHRQIAVADTGNNRIQVFHRNYSLNFVIGAEPPGAGDGNGTAVQPPPDGNGGTPPPDGNGTAVRPPPDGNGGTGTPDGNGGTGTPDGNGGTGTPDGNGMDPVQPLPTGRPATCSISLGTATLNVRAAPGGPSPAAMQVITNTGSLNLAGVAIAATPWHVDQAAASSPLPLPPSLTELSTAGAAPGGFVPLSADGTAPAPLAAGLSAGSKNSLWFRINLGGLPDGQSAGAAGGMLTQNVTYTAECAPPPPPA